MSFVKRVMDNKFWFIGKSYSDLGDNSLCIIVRNPWDDLRGTNDRARSKQQAQSNQSS